MPLFFCRWTIDVGWTSTWVRIVNEWLAVCVYCKKIITPSIIFLIIGLKKCFYLSGKSEGDEWLIWKWVVRDLMNVIGVSMSCVSIISPLTIVGAMVKPYLLEFDVMHFHRVAMMIYRFTSNYLFACLLFTLSTKI